VAVKFNANDWITHEWWIIRNSYTLMIAYGQLI
jgi:hypothetical protein